MPPRTSPVATGISGAEHECLLVDDCQHVACGQDQVLLAVVLDLGAAVLAVDNDVALGHVQRNPLLTVLIPAAGANCDDGAFLRLLLGGVGNDQTGCGRGLGLVGLYEDLVLEWLDVHARHDWSPPVVGWGPGPLKTTAPNRYWYGLPGVRHSSAPSRRRRGCRHRGSTD